jgi:hypothetical protein
VAMMLQTSVFFSPTYGIWEQAWLSLFYHRFILVWFAFEVRPQHMLWLILGLLWYFYSKFIELMHLAYGVTQTITYILSFMLFLVNWGAWHMQWWPTFLSLQSNLISCTWLLTGKKTDVRALCFSSALLYYALVLKKTLFLVPCDVTSPLFSVPWFLFCSF